MLLTVDPLESKLVEGFADFLKAYKELFQVHVCTTLNNFLFSGEYRGL